MDHAAQHDQHGEQRGVPLDAERNEDDPEEHPVGPGRPRGDGADCGEEPRQVRRGRRRAGAAQAVRARNQGDDRRDQQDAEQRRHEGEAGGGRAKNAVQGERQGEGQAARRRPAGEDERGDRGRQRGVHWRREEAAGAGVGRAGGGPHRAAGDGGHARPDRPHHQPGDRGAVEDTRRVPRRGRRHAEPHAQRHLEGGQDFGGDERRQAHVRHRVAHRRARHRHHPRVRRRLPGVEQ
mmetsp:Transcript_55493/g.136114  ORF Transcript_55493/g.136114 Transcript_55493/m.136114 type:complete len:236 (-) Transcript_55493:470-1177(-)